jgi:hypothetical protein
VGISSPAVPREQPLGLFSRGVQATLSRGLVLQHTPGVRVPPSTEGLGAKDGWEMERAQYSGVCDANPGCQARAPGGEKAQERTFPRRSLGSRAQQARLRGEEHS